MSVNLQRGANTSLQAAVAEHGSRLRIVLEWAGDHPDNPAVDAVAFLISEAGKVRSDADMIYHNHPVDAAGFILKTNPENKPGGLREHGFILNLDKVPEGIDRACFCLAVQTGGSGVLYIDQLSQMSWRVLGGSADTELARADFKLADTSETALIMGEVYRRKGEWKAKCVAQGFRAGLGAMAESYGVIVAEGAKAVGPMTRPSSPAPVVTTTTKSAVPSIKLEKPYGGFGEIQVILNWGAPPPPPPAPGTPPPPAATAGKGLLGSLLGGSNKPAPVNTIDLDLCCLFELSDGYRGVVQALGNNFGSFQAAPFIELLGDERQGGGLTAQGEVLRINGKRWDEIRRILFFSMIFNGIPNWQKANGRARILVPDQPPISVRLDQPTLDQRACSIALMENEGGKLVIHKRVETFKNPRELDGRYGWGLRWSAGTKD